MKLSDRLLGDTKPHPSSRVAAALRAGGVPRTAEFGRIAGLPRRTLDLAQVIDVTPAYALERPETHNPCRLCAGLPKGQAPTLRPIQSAALLEASAMGGGFFPLGVGAGKTLISLLLPLAMESRRAVLLVPPQLRGQLLHVDLPAAAAHFVLPKVMHLASAVSVADALAEGRPLLYVVAYSELSTAGNADALERIAPDLIIADEAHNLRHRDAARTRRFLRYFRDVNSGCRFVAMSGTMTSRSIRDYAHLIHLALRGGSPLPQPYRELEAWADALDVSPEPAPPGALTLLCKDDAEPVRDAFRRRLVESYGVVATAEGALGTSLTIRGSGGRGAFVLPALRWLSREVTTALETLTTTWAWDGQEHEDAMAVARVARQLSQGFFYRWAWPGAPDRGWLDARNAWARAVRAYLGRHNRPGLDSPLLLASACARGDAPNPDLADAWDAWAVVKDRPAPPVVPVWLSWFLIDAAGEWTRARLEPGIIWVEHSAVGEALAARGWAYYGPGSDAALIDADPSQSIVCSIRAHGTGKNLQAWSRNLVLCPPSSGATWEQLLGRTHRPGQTADEVLVDVATHTPALEAALASAIRDAEYIQATTGNAQKLLYAARNV